MQEATCNTTRDVRVKLLIDALTQSPASHSHELTLHWASQYPSPIQLGGQPSLQLGTAHERNTFWPWEGVIKSDGHTGAPNMVSSLRYKKCSESPGIRCRLASMAGEEKVGRWLALAKMSACVTSCRRGWLVSSQWGTCPLVTRYTRRTQGANFSSERIEKRSSSLSAGQRT